MNLRLNLFQRIVSSLVSKFHLKSSKRCLWRQNWVHQKTIIRIFCAFDQSDSFYISFFQKTYRGPWTSNLSRLPIPARGRRSLGLHVNVDCGQLRTHRGVQAALQTDSTLSQGKANNAPADIKQDIK